MDPPEVLVVHLPGHLREPVVDGAEERPEDEEHVEDAAEHLHPRPPWDEPTLDDEMPSNSASHSNDCRSP